MRIYILAFTVLIAATSRSPAEILEFKEHNCAIERPADWTVTDPPPPQTLVQLKHTNGSKIVMLVAAKRDKKIHAVTRAELFAGLSQNSKDNGVDVVDEPDAMLDGVPFDVFLGRSPQSGSFISYSTVTEDECYMLQGMLQGYGINTDAEILAVLKSFRFLSPVQALPRGDRPGPPAAQAETAKGSRPLRTLLVAVMIGVVIVLAISLRKKPAAN